MELLTKYVRSYSVIIICTLLVLLTVAVYIKVGGHQFLNFDDPSYVTENLHVSSGITVDNIFWAFSSIDAGNWHPLTWLSHMADVQLYGVNPRGHHITNVIFHATSSVLLLLLLFRCTGSLWQSSFVAALFALHPLHVESVAWVAERKDVLSAFLGLLTLCLYAEYVAKRNIGLYILAFLVFVLGLLSKPMLVTLPIIMLLMDYWPLDRYRHTEKQGLLQLSGRTRAVIIEKAPFFLCSLLSGLITMYAQHKGGATNSLTSVPVVLRIENALVAYVKYIGKTLWPTDLAVLYPLPVSFPLWQVIGSLLVLFSVTVATVRVRNRHPFLVVGWLWFLVTLVPVIGLIQVGSQSMADRYSYIPVIGLFIMAAWGVPVLTNGFKRRKSILALLAGSLIITSAVLTWQQLGYWQNNISLYQHALHVTSGSYLVHSNLGIAFAEEGDLTAAIREYRQAIRISPYSFDAHGNLGLALLETGDLDGALMECQIALQLNPGSSNSHYNLGVALAAKGALEAATHEYHEAIRSSPNNSKMHTSLGRVYAENGDFDAAIQEYTIALRISPGDIFTRNNLDRALAQKRMKDSGT